MRPLICIKRVYSQKAISDGVRILADRVWPRGLTKEEVACDYWLKELTPDTALRKWYNHEPEKWAEFQLKYTLALKNNSYIDTFTDNFSKVKKITLLYAAKDEQHTHALVLQKFLEQAFIKKEMKKK